VIPTFTDAPGTSAIGGVPMGLVYLDFFGIGDSGCHFEFNSRAIGGIPLIV